MTKTTFPLFSLFLFVASHSLYASLIELPSQQLHQTGHRMLRSEKRTYLVDGYCRTFQVPFALCTLIRTFLYGNPLQYKHKNLPEDFSEEDLCGFDFTGCKFMRTNLTNTNLQDTILKNTTCSYLELFEENRKKTGKSQSNFLLGWYAVYITRYLTYISEFYQNVESDKIKAKLLHIASAFSRLPFYSGIEVNIKSQYWCWELKLLDDQKLLKFNNDDWPLVFQFAHRIKQGLINSCWRTTYIESRNDLCKDKLHANFPQYLENFNNGLIRYKDDRWFKPKTALSEYQNNVKNCFARHIRASIKGLEKAYPKIESKNFQQKACEIAAALSKSYRFGKNDLYRYYLDCQNCLIWLKEMTGVECIYYYFYEGGTVQYWG